MTTTTKIFSGDETILFEETTESENRPKRVKKGSASESVSNLLIFLAVVLALAPLVLGQRLPLILGDVMREGSTMLDQVVTFVSGLAR